MCDEKNRNNKWKMKAGSRGSATVEREREARRRAEHYWRVKNVMKEVKNWQPRDVRSGKTNGNESYLFIQMSFHVVYKWEHEAVINHKARNVLV